MKLHLIHNEKGKILAAVQVDSGIAVLPIPVPGTGHCELVLDVPEHSNKSLHEICRTHQVDVKANALVAIVKS
jgi:hypothetical protein